MRRWRVRGGTSILVGKSIFLFVFEASVFLLVSLICYRERFRRSLGASVLEASLFPRQLERRPETGTIFRDCSTHSGHVMSTSHSHLPFHIRLTVHPAQHRLPLLLTRFHKSALQLVPIRSFDNRLRFSCILCHTSHVSQRS